MTPENAAIESISAFFPCYNDEATIASMVNLAVTTIERVGANGEVIVVNDGSTDGSPAVLRELSDRQPWLRMITHGQNRGYGGALISGFAAATMQWVFYTDGDAQFDPSELALLAEHAAPDVDVVQGYKIRRADNIARRVIGRVYHRFVSFAFGLRIRDTDCDFRLIRRSMMEKIRLEHSTGVICVELVRKLQDAGARFVEVPIHHYPRLYGRSKFFRLGSVLRSLRDLAALWVQLVVLRRGRTSVAGREHDDRSAERHVPVGQAATLRRGQGSEDPVE